MPTTVVNGQFIQTDLVDEQPYIVSMARLASGGFVALLQGSSALSVQILDAGGKNVGAPIQIASVSGYVGVTGLTNGGFAVAWTTSPGSTLSTQMFNSSGEAISNVTQLSQSLSLDVQLSPLATGGYVVGWREMISSSYKFQSLDGQGALVGPAASATVIPFSYSDLAILALPDGKTLTALSGGVSGALTITVKAYDQTGTPAATNFVAITLPSDVTFADVSLTKLASGNVLLSWFAQGPANGIGDLKGQIYTAAGVSTGDSFTIPTGGISSSTYIAALDDGRFVATYRGVGAQQGQVLAQLFDEHAGPVGMSFLVSVAGDSTSRSPIITAFGTNDFAVAWAYGIGSSGDSSVRSYFSAADGIPFVQPPDAFKLISATGWTGSIGGNGTIAGSNGLDDITLLSGAITLDGSFNRGGDTIRLAGNAGGYTINRSGTSNAIVADEAGLHLAIPLGLVGLNMAFGDGTRKLVFEGGAYKIGAQTFGLESAAITAAGDTATPLPAGDPNVQASLIMTGTTLQPGQTAHATVGGRLAIAGTNDGDVIAVAQTGGAVVFDGSFNRGGDVIVLSGNASTYTATRQGSSTMVIADANEQLSIPIGTVGLTLRFADGDRTLVFQGGKYLVGTQEIVGTAANQLSNFDKILTLDQGTIIQSVTLDATGKVQFTDDASVTGNVRITNFTLDDMIRVTHASAADYNFSASVADPRDLELTFNSGGTSNRIVIDNVIAPGGFVADYTTAVQALGWNFLTFG